MRVLHLALNQARQPALCDALASLGEYQETDWIAETAKKGNANFQRDLIAMANEYQPDVTFMQLQTPGVIDPETARQLPGFRINWTGDVRQPLPDWYIDLGRVIDLSLFTNMTDVEAMRTAGCKAEYLQIGFDPNIFNAQSEIEKSVPEIIFMGNHYGMDMYPLSRWRYDMVHTLHEHYGSRFQLYGGNWDIPAKIVEHNTPAERDIYRAAKIGINLSHFALPRYSSDRIHSIMGSGTFCLTHFYPNIYDEFTENELGIFFHLNELVESIDFFLKIESFRERIARRGFDLVHGRDTWAHRIEQLKTMLPSA